MSDLRVIAAVLVVPTAVGLWAWLVFGVIQPRVNRKLDAHRDRKIAALSAGSPKEPNT